MTATRIPQSPLSLEEFKQIPMGTKFYAVDALYGNEMKQYWYAGINPKAANLILGIYSGNVRTCEVLRAQETASLARSGNMLFFTEYEDAKRAFIAATEKRLQTVREVYVLEDEKDELEPGD